MVGIKGWEMPEKCADCALCIDVPQMKGKDLWCCGGLEKSPIIETFYDGIKPDFCPLVEVPDWHKCKLSVAVVWERGSDLRC